MTAQNQQLAKLFAAKFISRPDVFAQQKMVMGHAGWKMGYAPFVNGTEDYIPFSMPHLLSHLEGRQTFGHYLVGQDSTVKLFCLDIDFTKLAKVPVDPPFQPWENFTETDPRELWRTVTSNGSWLPGKMPEVARYLVYNLRLAAEGLVKTIQTELDIPAAVLYSGNKGFHVYGFLPKGTPASDARVAGQIALEASGWTLFRGNSLYTRTEVGPGPVSGETVRQASNAGPSADLLSIELFPKQDSLDGKDLGNLLRLPLGINKKGGAFNTSFFVDLRVAMTELVAMDPVEALTTSNLWGHPGE